MGILQAATENAAALLAVGICSFYAGPLSTHAKVAARDRFDNQATVHQIRTRSFFVFPPGRPRRYYNAWREARRDSRADTL